MCILRYTPQQRAVRIDDGRRVVVETGRTALKQRSDDHDAVFLGQLLVSGGRRTWNRFGEIEETVFLALAKILGSRPSLACR